MKAKRYDNASRRYAFVAVVGIAIIAFLVLISIVSATQNSVYWFDKVLENEIKASEKAIEINPQNSTAWSEKGSNLYVLGRDDEAIKACDRAIELNPQNTDAWLLKGKYLTRQNRLDEAIKVYDKIIELNGKGIALTKIRPQSLGASIAWTSKGDVLEQLGKYDDAMKAYDKAIKINPHNEAASISKGVLSKWIINHKENADAPNSGGNYLEKGYPKTG
jgi:tetratricopeptide (TPR) repeat protein